MKIVKSALILFFITLSTLATNTAGANVDRTETCSLFDLKTIKFGDQELTGEIVGKIEKDFSNNKLVDIRFNGVETSLNLSNSFVSFLKSGTILLVKNNEKLDTPCAEVITVYNNTLLHQIQCDKEPKEETFGITDCK